MAKVNLNVLKYELGKGLERAFKDKAIAIARTRFDDVKKEFLDSFENDSISLEIKQGPELSESPNLGVPGNLFGFLGFNAGDKPITELYNFFNNSIQINLNPIYKYSTQTYSFRVSIPSKEDIAAVTPMEWGTATSWVLAIERGIPGLNYYLFTRLAKTSRSTAGIQVRANLNSGGFTPRSYISPLLNFLRKSLES